MPAQGEQVRHTNARTSTHVGAASPVAVPAWKVEQRFPLLWHSNDTHRVITITHPFTTRTRTQ
jgi:hypothetical protein